MIYFFMEDMYMNEFNTNDKVKSLFESFGMNGNQNSYFIGYVKAPTKASLLGGAVGGMVAGMQAAQENQCSAYLINGTNEGIGLIPLVTGDGSALFALRPDKLVPVPNKFYFFKNEEIKSLKIKRANLISLVSKEITIKLGNGRVINLMVNNKEKALPYHEMELQNL